MKMFELQGKYQKVEKLLPVFLCSKFEAEKEGDISSNFENLENWHCVKSVRIGSFSGPYLSTFGLSTERNKVDQKTSRPVDSDSAQVHNLLCRKFAMARFSDNVPG